MSELQHYPSIHFDSPFFCSSTKKRRKKKIRRIIDDTELGEETKKKIAIEKVKCTPVFYYNTSYQHATDKDTSTGTSRAA